MERTRSGAQIRTVFASGRHSLSISAALCLLLGALSARLHADGPADNQPENVRRVPKPGIELPKEVREELEGRVAALCRAIESLRNGSNAAAKPLLSDIEIYTRAVGEALKHNEFFKEEEFAKAKALLTEGEERAARLESGSALWAAQTGLLVRGYVSKIDGSVQPYGLVVPASYSSASAGRYRLDIWFHGRDEVLSEVNFLDGRRRQSGTFTPPDTLVLHPYGRYCNAFKLAGEVDVLEALESVKARYRIDDDRIAVRGFSMGGAATWHFAVHYADRWVGANPGAGFAETPEFLKVFQRETLRPAWYEVKLWRLYDATDSALNLVHCPTVAYSGEKDNQKQAADIMEAALGREGIDLEHVIGPGTGHQYHPEARAEVDRRMSEIALRGRDRAPPSVRFVTHTLRYNRMAWVAVDGLGEHWKRARVEADIDGRSAATLRTENVTALTLSFSAGWCPFDPTSELRISIDGQAIAGPRPKSDRSWSLSLHRERGQWKAGSPADESLRKRHGLQGPIDDAFMDSFVFVRPTGKCRSEIVERWTRAELDRAVERWRRQFRGDARIVDDTAVGPKEIEGSNLVLWGDPASNSVLGKIAESLPIRWNTGSIAAGSKELPAGEHALIAIYPNPLNPRRYVVLNSGFTYREYDDLNNARQMPKLPDWAVIDLRTPPGPRFPGKIAAAGFFNENWGLKDPPGRE